MPRYVLILPVECCLRNGLWRSARFTINMLIAIIFGTLSPLMYLLAWVNFWLCHSARKKIWVSGFVSHEILSPEIGLRPSHLWIPRCLCRCWSASNRELARLQSTVGAVAMTN